MAPETDPHHERRSDPRPTTELIRIALTEEDEDAALDPVKTLQFRGTKEVLESAIQLCKSPFPKERELGANILGQLGLPDRTFPEDCFQVLAAMLSDEKEPIVLAAIAIAFGHLNDPRAIPLLAPLKKHSDSDVRYGVVHGMSRHKDKLAIQTLIDLSKDSDMDVRNWATFGLGSMIDIDTPEIRKALFDRSTESDREIRGEALVGLARRKDNRVLDLLIEELSLDHVGILALEAAEELGDPKLVPSLMALHSEWENDPEDSCTRQLQQALLSCLPHGNC